MWTLCESVVRWKGLSLPLFADSHIHMQVSFHSVLLIWHPTHVFRTSKRFCKKVLKTNKPEMYVCVCAYVLLRGLLWLLLFGIQNVLLGEKKTEFLFRRYVFLLFRSFLLVKLSCSHIIEKFSFFSSLFPLEQHKICWCVRTLAREDLLTLNFWSTRNRWVKS